MLAKLSKVSLSGYYKWSKRQKNVQEVITGQRILDLYQKVKGIYGYRRLTASYRQNYLEVINHKKVYRIMQNLGIKAQIRKKRKNFYYGYYGVQIKKENILNQNFNAGSYCMKWTTDITNLYYKNSRIYLSVILDLYNKEIVSYQLGKKKDNQLVIKTINEAIKNVGKIKSSRGIILHSDQGSSYTTEYYANLLKSYGIEQSMSRRGNCLDNSPVECFFSHLKSELMYLRSFNSEEEMVAGVKQYIKFYNTERIQEKLKYLAPVSYRIQEDRNKHSYKDTLH